MTPSPQNVWTLPTEHLGRRVQVFDILDSTNTHALALADDPAQHGVVILAREQSAGRGQYGRSWHAPPGSSVLMSLLMFPPEPLRRPALLTAWAAVSVCETLGKLAHLHATIKWPNDVLVHGKKVSGILIEQRTTSNADFPLATVVGIGLNVTQSAAMFEQAGLPGACSLAMLSAATLTFDNVATSLVRELDAQYARLIDGDRQTLQSQWQRRLGLLGQSVLVESSQQSLRGKLQDVTFTAIELEDETGEHVRIPPESVRHLHPLR